MRVLVVYWSRALSLVCEVALIGSLGLFLKHHIKHPGPQESSLLLVQPNDQGEPAVSYK